MLDDIETVLIVDNETYVLDELKAVLEELCGVRVVEAKNLIQARKHLQGMPQPNITITDVGLGQETGVDIAEDIPKGTLLAFMTGDSRTSQHIAELGLKCLRKPFSSNDVVRTITELCHNREDYMTMMDKKLPILLDRRAAAVASVALANEMPVGLQ